MQIRPVLENTMLPAHMDHAGATEQPRSRRIDQNIVAHRGQSVVNDGGQAHEERDVGERHQGVTRWDHTGVRHHHGTIHSYSHFWISRDTLVGITTDAKALGFIPPRVTVDRPVCFRSVEHAGSLYMYEGDPDHRHDPH